MTPRIIGFCGLATSGKSALADAFVNRYPVYARVSFAAPLKEMLRIIIPGQVNKTDPIPEICGHTYRYACQTLGTEWGREMIGENIWSDHLIRNLDPAGCYVVDDVRFDNEAAALRELGAVIVRVNRPGRVVMVHASEVGVPDHLVDFEIYNTGTLDESLDALLSNLERGDA